MAMMKAEKTCENGHGGACAGHLTSGFTTRNAVCEVLQGRGLSRVEQFLIAELELRPCACWLCGRLDNTDTGWYVPKHGAGETAPQLHWLFLHRTRTGSQPSITPVLIPSSGYIKSNTHGF